MTFPAAGRARSHSYDSAIEARYKNFLGIQIEQLVEVRKALI
jgi:hypothetical protein